MSSLAGALDETHVSSYVGFGDMNMSSPSRKGTVKEEQDPGPKEEGDQEMDDLFGNDQEVIEPKHEDAGSPAASGPDSERLTSPERERRQALEYEEEEAPQELAVEVKEAEVAFPNIPLPRSLDDNNWVIKMPNYVRVDTKPFHPETYIGPEQEEEEFQQSETVREKTMSIKLRVENTVRWRWTKDENGRDIKQSNSRIIRWSDGSLSLRLGKEIFDITQMVDTSGTVPRQSIGGSQSQSSQSQRSTAGKSQGLTYLVAQHKRSQVLQAEAIITGYMQLRPTGMHSETHRMLVRAVGQKHSKVARLRMAPDPTMDPEREKLELMKQSAKKSRKKLDQDDGFGRRQKRRNWRETASRDWTDDEEVVGASEEEDDDRMGSARKTKRKDPGRKTAEEYQEDDFVVADESDEEATYSGNKKKRRGEDGGEDLLDKLDAKIQDEEEEDQPHEDDKDDNDMDVESEEDEEGEFQVRRASTSRSRKRAVNAKQEEEEE
ncbi:RNA polymerase II-associated protein [Amanita muscaria]